MSSHLRNADACYIAGKEAIVRRSASARPALREKLIRLTGLLERMIALAANRHLAATSVASGGAEVREVRNV